MTAGGIAKKAFGRATAIPRKLNILPEELDTPQSVLDVARRKKKVKNGSFLGKSINRGSLLSGVSND